jgi:hypothetical protein
MNGLVPKDLAVNQVVPASQTNKVVSHPIRVTASGSRHFRMDIYTGKVVVAAAVSAGFQHSSGFGMYEATKSTTIAANAATAITAVAPSTDILTAVAHGLVDGDVVGITATAMPGGILNTVPYFVKKIDADTFQLSIINGGAAVDITSAGTSPEFTKMQLDSITFQLNVAGDQTYLPLRSLGRAVMTTGAGDSAQLLGIVILQED